MIGIKLCAALSSEALILTTLTLSHWELARLI